MAANNITHHVTAIPEILDNIFRHTDNGDLAQIAQVCKIWSDVALAALWGDTKNLHRLFSILSPLHVIDDPLMRNSSKYHFRECPSAADWTRFEKYASLVRKLVYEPPIRTRTKPISRAVFLDIASSRTHLDVFRNLKSLVWTPSTTIRDPGGLKLSDAYIFMHANIRSFIFSWGMDSDLARAKLIADIPVRMPNLNVIGLRRIVQPSTPVIEVELAQMFMNLPNLQRVTLPSFLLTGRIFEALSTLPNLDTINYSPVEDQERGLPEHTGRFLPSVSQNGFPELQYLTVSSPFGDFSLLLNSDWAPKHLTSLRLDSRVAIELPSEVHDLLLAMSCKISSLRTLVLVSKRVPPRDDGIDELPDVIINWSIISPITLLSSLSHLEIAAAFPLQLATTDINSLISSLPQIETLLLNKAPAYLDECQLGLDVLETIAHNCPHLRRLGLFVNASLPVPTPALIYANPDVPADPFPALAELSLGVSIITGTVVPAVSLYLSKMLPSTCNLAYGHDWIQDNRQTRVSNRVFNKIIARSRIWKQVEDFLTLFSQVRQDERDKVLTQNRRLQNLK